ncbi:MAG: hypothetical protein L3K04_04550, partial [Thermoplasmata archaeon]|nr:hypothetical protein [Thermoplasmata archaeon]
TSYAPINASAVLDSTAAVQDFNAEGGTAWAQNHTVLTRLFALVSATRTGGVTIWGMQYSTCNIASTSGNGLEFSGGINASTGVPLASPSQSTMNC